MKYFSKKTMGFVSIWLLLTVLLLLFHFWDFSPIISNSSIGDYKKGLINNAVVNNGAVPYRDFFENKGPLWIFLLAGLNSLTPWSLLSSAVLTGICCLGLFILSYKIARLFLNPYPSFLVSFFPILLLRLIRQNTPDTEFFLSVIILLGIYASCKLLLNHKMTKRQQWLWGMLNGIAFALTFWTKYQLVGLWLGLLFTIILLLILQKLPSKKFLQLLLSHFLGFIIPTLAVIVYFGMHSALGDLFSTYFFSRYNFGISDSSTIPNTPEGGIAPTIAVVLNVDRVGLYTYLALLALLAILTLIALVRRNYFALPFKIFIFSAIACSFVLILAMFWLKETESAGTRNFAPIVCCSIVALIYWVDLAARKIPQRTLLKIPRIASTGVILGIFGLIYLSGFFGTQQSYVQYIWDSKNTPIQLPDSAVTHFQDGPYPYEQMSNYLKTYYPDAKVTTLDSNLAFELHQPQILKYSYCAPNPYFCQLHYQEVNLKISDSQINLLSIYLPISNPDQLASLESINNQLTNYFGENSVFRISQSILDEFKPIFAVNQYSSMVVYLVRGLTT